MVLRSRWTSEEEQKLRRCFRSTSVTSTTNVPTKCTNISRVKAIHSKLCTKRGVWAIAVKLYRMKLIPNHLDKRQFAKHDNHECEHCSQVVNAPFVPPPPPNPVCVPPLVPSFSPLSKSELVAVVLKDRSGCSGIMRIKQLVDDLGFNHEDMFGNAHLTRYTYRRYLFLLHPDKNLFESDDEKKRTISAYTILSDRCTKDFVFKKALYREQK